MAEKSKKKVSKKTSKKNVEKIELKKLPREKDEIITDLSKKGKQIKKNIAIIALILNALILPGLGTLIGGRNKKGLSQLILFIGGMILGTLIIPIGNTLETIGIIFFLGAISIAWIWGILSGIELIKESI